MTTYTIKQAMSNTGSIHGIASEHSDRVIVFSKDCIYAGVLASHYNDGKGYTTHKTEKAAIAQSRKLSKDGWSHRIIDTDGNLMDIIDGYWGGELVASNR